ncbi:MAG: HNH endonuclease [Treponema sp.]|nr:HNH endonuclease [Treponema sp.]
MYSCSVINEQYNEIYNEQLANIKQHYQNQLENLQKRIEAEIFPREIIDIQSLYNKNPFLYANEKHIFYELNDEEIKSIEDEISTKLFKSKADKIEIEKRIKLRKLSKIESAFNKEYESLLFQETVKEIIYEDTPESILFQKKYKNNYELYAEDSDLEFIVRNNFNYSQYVFILEENTVDKTYSVITKNEPLYKQSHVIRYAIDIDTKNIKKHKKQVLMYSKRFDTIAFFLYRNCLYQADFDEILSDDELLLRVKEKIYAEDEKYEQLKTKIEFHESDVIVNNPKRKRPAIPSAVKREVFLRDQGRCVICGSRENIEFDHELPFSKGGSSTVRNIRLLCQKCNRHKSDNF